MEHLVIVVFLLISYLLGACPNGLLIARANGVDIRSVGSGNIGATNVFRSIGKGPGLAVFLLDALKGFVPAVLFPAMADRMGASLPLSEPGIWFGLAAIMGHNWPVYLRFKGGKGVATSAGVLVGVAPFAVGIGLLAWSSLFLATRYVSVASIVAAVVVAAVGWIRYLETGLALPAVLTLLAVLIIWRHRSNVQRLAAGKENRFSFTREPRVSDPGEPESTSTSTGEQES